MVECISKLLCYLCILLAKNYMLDVNRGINDLKDKHKYMGIYLYYPCGWAIKYLTCKSKKIRAFNSVLDIKNKGLQVLG